MDRGREAEECNPVGRMPVYHTKGAVFHPIPPKLMRSVGTQLPESSHLGNKFHLAGRAKTEYIFPGPETQLLSCFFRYFIFVC